MIDVMTAVLGGSLLLLVWLSVWRTVFTQGQVPSRAARWTTRATAAMIVPLGARLGPAYRERLLALCAPAALFAMFGGWFLGNTLGFMLLAVSVGVIGPTSPDVAGMLAFALDGQDNLFAVGAAGSGVLLVAVFAVYLVRVVGAYHRRELLVARLSSHAATPADAERVIAALVRSDSRVQLDAWFTEWIGWFADIRCSHVHHPPLMYLRPASKLCWPDAALIVLDVAALVEATAPDWAPANTRLLLETGACCLQRLAADVGIVLPRSTISLHGREQRGFADTIRITLFAGLPVARSQQLVWEVFQRERTRYAPYAAAVAARLRYELDPGRAHPDPVVMAEQHGER